jgi:hypothetical protein
MRVFFNMTSGRFTCLCRVLEILASKALCHLSHWFSHCVLIYLNVIFVLLNTHELYLCTCVPGIACTGRVQEHVLRNPL